MSTSHRFPFLLLCSFLMTSTIAAAQPAVDAGAKPFIGTWIGKEDRQTGLPAPMLKIQNDGKGGYFLGKIAKPLSEFTWSMGEEQFQAANIDGKRFYAAILRPDGKLVWRQVKLPAGVKDEGREFEKVPSDF